MTPLLAQDPGLTVPGAVVMAISIIGVLGLCTFCVCRLVREPKPEQHMHTPLDMDTHDTE